MNSCLIKIPIKNISRRTLESFAMEINDLAGSYAPHVGAAVSIDLDSKIIEVIFTPDEILTEQN